MNSFGGELYENEIALENIEELIIPTLASEDDEYQDRIVYLPLP
ncbi:hypothetical protein [Nostoc sphaeroides]|uniref:Uncharacterized protein n=1 Tax=Nostoc sphaeroides CCNUC1 TaxID=2653204 RepID=A0A5P8VV74_9NOSO|nr:hypothetical protein [Nostoc sphaeroides]QFS44318.1 hypothetical protein GXM_01791 [Nostoc sphaeroides CCNUC1]